MHFVYILQSQSKPDEYYGGITNDLDDRLIDHNSGKSTHTKKFIPWKIISYFYFADEQKAVMFEKYLKSGSGRAFAKKRLR